MIMLALASGVCAAMWMKTRQQADLQPSLWLIGAVVFALVVGIFSISRNAQIVLLTMPLVLLIHRYRSLKGIFFTLVACVIFSLIAWTLFPSVSLRFTAAIVELRNVLNNGNCESSVGVRFAMYEMAWHQLLQHPWMGTGVGSFVDFWRPLAENNCPTTAGIRQPHNDFLLFAMETGWLGLLTTWAVIIWFANKFWKQATIYGTAGLMLCLTFIITGMMNSPMRDAGIGFVMIFLMATCYENRIRKSI
jgi:O-antigen ligase